MGWTTFIWSMNAGICLAIAGVHLLVWLQNHEYRTNLAFALSAIAAAITAVFELVLMHSQTTAQYGQIFRWMHVPVFALAVSFIWFVGLYLKVGRAWLLWLYLAVRVLVLVVNLVSMPNISFQEITSLHFVTIWGDTFAAATGIPSPWRSLIRFSDALLLLFIADASYAAWKEGRRRRTLITGTAFFVAVSLAVASSVVLGNKTLGVLPLTVSMPFLFVILVMGVDMSLDLSRVQEISRELQENQQRLMLAVKAADLGIWEWDIAKNEIWATEAGRERVGVREDEKISIERFLQSVHPEDREKVRADVRRTIEGTGTSEPEAEYRVIAEDGSLRWISSRGKTERDRKGRPILVRGVTVDITTRVLAEEALRDNLEKYSAMVQAFDGYIYICSQDYRIEFMNQRMIERTGYDAVGEPCYKALHGKDAVCEWCVNEKVFHGETVQWEVLGPRDDRWYFVVNTPIRHADGTVSKQAMIQDITERKQAETELKESEARFRATFEQAAVGIAHVVSNGRFFRINRKFCEIFGYTREEMLALALQDITHSDDLGEDVQKAESFLGGGREILMVEKRFRHKTGSPVWGHLTISPVHLEAEQPGWFVVVIKDISDRKKAEIQIFDYQKRLKTLASQLTLVEERERRRIAADLHDNVGQTLAMIRLQLAAAIGAVDDAVLKTQLDDVSKTLLKATRDTRHLIFELSSPTMGELGLGAAISEWVDEKIKKRNGIQIELVDKLKDDEIDQDIRVILFRNARELLTNILKHAHADRVKVVLEKVECEIHILIQDNGVGFEPHQIGSNTGNEGGFGLLSVQERMSDMGGKLEIRSELHRGTTMVMTLPS